MAVSDSDTDLPPNVGIGLSPSEAKQLAIRSDRTGLLHLAGHLAAITAAVGLVLMGRAVLPGHAGVGALIALPGVGILGLLLVFLFAPLHETVHRTAFRRRWLNDAVAAVTGAVLVLPPTWFRAYHMAHHRHTQDPDRDPERMVPAVRTWAGYVWRLSGLPYWSGQIAGLVARAAGHADAPFLPTGIRRSVILEARVYLGIYGALLLGSVSMGSMVLLWVWVAPVVTAMPALRAFLMAEHDGCPESPAMLLNSRTTETGPLLAWLSWNMNRHTAHHAHPGVPFHALPALDRLLGSRVQVRETGGYRAVHHAIWRRLGAPA